MDNYNYKVAIYCRLSREDEGTVQSESITNQKDFLAKYVREQGWELFNTYIDDGYSGTNFDRPAFKELLRDIEKKWVNLVITKDLSRLGRDYVETGYYLEKYFPEKRVRYIAVTDGIDTSISSQSVDFTPFRSVINDLYARDISVKVRNAMDTKRQAGKFIGPMPPYGYSKDPKDKNKLVIDEETAPIVERIFEMFVLEGYGYSKISHILNDEGVITPTEYKNQLRGHRGYIKTNLWNHNTIKVILKNPTYTGNLRQGVNKKISYKSKKYSRIPEGDWIIVEGTHEAIVQQEIFDEAQKRMNESNGKFKYGKTTRLFSGMVRCGDCGEFLTFYRKASSYLICSTYKRFTAKYCSRHSIQEELLKELVMSDLREMAAKAIDRKRLVRMVDSIKLEKNKPTRKLEQDMKQFNNKLQEIEGIIKSLYIDRVNGIITPEQFLELSRGFGTEKDTLDKQIKIIMNKLVRLDRVGEKNDIEAMVDELLIMKDFDRRTLGKLVEKIEVWEDKRIKIHYWFSLPQ